MNESGGSTTIGDASGDEAFLQNTAAGTYDILDNSGIAVGASPLSNIKNLGLLEKTGGTGTSVIAPVVTNTGTIEVTAATLAFQGAVTGTGSDEIFGASKLEFHSTVSAGQTVSFAGSGGTLGLTAPARFSGLISGFDTVGAGSNDTIEVARPWVFTGFTENARRGGPLGSPIPSAQISLTLFGDYNPVHFVTQSGPTGSTLITYT